MSGFCSQADQRLQSLVPALKGSVFMNYSDPQLLPVTQRILSPSVSPRPRYSFSPGWCPSPRIIIIPLMGTSTCRIKPVCRGAGCCELSLV